MAHYYWCGKPCSECIDSCRIDEEIPCSPDCEYLNEDGTRNVSLCTESGCDAFDSDVDVSLACSV